jgi:hypothetical protein
MASKYKTTTKAQRDALKKYLRWMTGFEESPLYDDYQEYEGWTDREWDRTLKLVRSIIEARP